MKVIKIVNGQGRNYVEKKKRSPDAGKRRSIFNRRAQHKMLQIFKCVQDLGVVAMELLINMFHYKNSLPTIIFIVILSHFHLTARTQMEKQ